MSRVKKGQKFLDLGCCFGQVIRKLVHDGAPAENLVGTDLEQGFVDLGYDLFKDRGRLESTFTAGDFFGSEIVERYERSFDFVHAASFFHLFTWSEQVEVMSKAILLLRPVSGSLLFGRQTSFDQSGPFEHPATRSGEMFRHDEASFRELVSQVQAEFGTNLKVEVNVHDNSKWAPTDKDPMKWRMMYFCITT